VYVCQVTTRTPLSAEAIASAAVALVDSEGLEALSMRRVGAALGYQAMSLYNHVPDRAAVVDAAVASVYREIRRPKPSDPWDKSVRALTKELRRVVLAHPNFAVVMLTAPPTCLEVQQPTEVLLRALQQTTSSEQLVARRFWMLINYVTGALLAEIASTHRSPQQLDVASGLAECPALAALSPTLASCNFAAEFQFGVEAIIESFQP
jgi:AcrR family transcriptional regulator